MNDQEKNERCSKVPIIMHDDGIGIKSCKVYTRWVYDCDDCSFNIIYEDLNK